MRTEAAGQPGVAPTPGSLAGTGRGGTPGPIRGLRGGAVGCEADGGRPALPSPRSAPRASRPSPAVWRSARSESSRSGPTGASRSGVCAPGRRSGVRAARASTEGARPAEGVDCSLRLRSCPGGGWGERPPRGRRDLRAGSETPGRAQTEDRGLRAVWEAERRRKCAESQKPLTKPAGRGRQGRRQWAASPEDSDLCRSAAREP